jgi:hypothetical protein
MWASLSIRFFATTILLGCVVIIGGCRRPSQEETAQTRQAQARADKESTLEYLKENGEVDWRKRVDAASQELDEAESLRRWGRSEESLEHALQAARLMPPPSKDFDAPSLETNGDGVQSGESRNGEMPEEDGSSDRDESVAEAGNPVSDDEVQQLRKSLESLFELLDGKTGRGSSGLSFERDAIEIR